MPGTRRCSVVAAALLLAISGTCIAGPKSGYLLHCAGCHLLDGSGVPDKVPSLRENLGWLVEFDDGRDYLVRVPGASQAPVNDEELTALINWVLIEFNSVAEDADLLSAVQVARSRTNVLADPEKLRDEIWTAYRKP